ncbi:unnamed protein product [Hyaloperonospora brassicae]|uniref:Uncharacterized protein n=1 Tax=Hyaloperonospora brassicae TaxID=162125 RepID=A0AAV0TU28_HYABA|nr:unnamed protein product [Hyaloperonospora brassicae]
MSREDESDCAGAESGQRSRKRQKSEPNEYEAQIKKLQQDVAEVKERLHSMSNQSSTNTAYELVKKCVEAKQKAATMRRKLAQHNHWLQRVSSLMETAPLFDYGVVDTSGVQADETKQDTTSHRSLKALDESHGQPRRKLHPRLLFGERLHAAVVVSQENVSKLLQDATSKAQSFHLSLEFESHGWEIATGTLVSDHMGFCCHRLLSGGADDKTKDVATALWNFVECDEIFRTFVPLVQASITTYQETNCSLSCRVIQLSQEMKQQAVATIESIRSTRDNTGQENVWQISMEAVHDHFLCTFVADASADAAMPNSAPPVKLDLGLQMSKVNMHNKFILGARVTKVDEGVDILIAGSARFDLPCYSDPAFDLLQHFVSHLPVYEDLYLTPLNDSQASDVHEM